MQTMTPEQLEALFTITRLINENPSKAMIVIDFVNTVASVHFLREEDPGKFTTDESITGWFGDSTLVKYSPLSAVLNRVSARFSK